jgi:pimeloyl-ACP methyl ester carboxylesterase/DNA-binding winged helix-turn-helix (wHTH) protein
MSSRQPESSARVLRFGPFRLDVRGHTLTRDGERISLRPQAFELLVYLATNPGRLVSKDELLAHLWTAKFVGDAVIKVAVRDVRRALDDAPEAPRFIETVPRCGYKLVAEVHEDAAAGEGALAITEAAGFRAALAATLEQEIRFCTTSDRVRLAFATCGAGPLLVKAANWLNHLDFDWHSPIWRHWLRELGRDHRLVRYDERGTGLSDWSVEKLDFASWVDDLEAVVDAVGAERFDLLGISQGVAVAIAYAVRHPERVRRLVLFGGYARGWAKRPNHPEATERRKALLTLTRLGWNQDNPAFRQVWTSQFVPDADEAQARSFNDLQRASTSAENAVRFLEEFGRIDIEELLRRVSAPSLVLHSRDDAAVPFDEGRRVAAGIPDSRFVALESRNHLLLPTEPAWGVFLAEVRRFLADPSPR